jgi:hypothetical protein
MQQAFPPGTAQRVLITSVSGDLNVYGWDQQTIQVDAGGKIEHMQPEGDTLTIHVSTDSLKLQVPIETVIVAQDVRGDTRIEGVRRAELSEARGDVGIKNIRESAALTNVKGDTSLNDISNEVSINNIGGDLKVSSVPLVRVGGQMKGDAAFLNVNRLEIDHIAGDLALKSVEEAAVSSVGETWK